MLGLLKRLDFLRTFFGNDPGPAADSPASKAKERLRNTLIMDQSSVSSELIGVIREGMIGLVSRYLEIDISHLQVALERRNSAIALAANIPIVRVRKEGRALVPNPSPIVSSREEAGGAVAVMEKPDAEAQAPEQVERRNRRGRKHSR